MEIPLRVLNSLADGADFPAAVLVGGRMLGVEKVLSKFPGRARCTRRHPSHGRGRP
jgi:hypothetical protein